MVIRIERSVKDTYLEERKEKILILIFDILYKQSDRNKKLLILRMKMQQKVLIHYLLLNKGCAPYIILY